MSNSSYRCEQQQRTILLIPIYQEASGIGDDEAEHVHVGEVCEHEQTCPDWHRCPLLEEDDF